MQPSVPEPQAKGPFDFARRNYHWVFAAIAAFLVLAHFVPAIYFAGLTADHVQIPLLFHDVVENGHPARDWVWGGHSDLFPDVSLAFLLEFILRNGLLSLQVAYGIILTAFITVLVVLYRQNGGRNAVTFAALLLLFFVLLLMNFGLHDGLEFTSVSTLALTQHTSIGIIALGCFALCQRAAVAGRWTPLFWLVVLCFATSLSDDIFLVLFTAPVFAALIVARLLYADRLRLFVPLVACTLIPSAAGHFLASRLSPFQIDAASYTHFHAASAAKAWNQFRTLCAPSAGGDFIVFVALDLLLVLFATAVLVRTFLKPAEQRIPLSLFLLLMFFACFIDCDWGAAILTGNFSGLLAARHVRLAILLPLFVLLGYTNDIIPWSQSASKIAVSGLSLVVSYCALFLAPPPSQYYLETQQLIPIIRSAMEKEHIEGGLADYWYANPIHFFSQDALPVRAVTNDGAPYHWLNTIKWYAGDGASHPPPEFRLIFMAALDADKIKRRYGAPAEIIPGLPGRDIWIYSKNKSITYNATFGTLSNDPADEYRIDGDMLPSLTGQREGNSRVARAGRDHPNFIIVGPYPYLLPGEGRYRISIFHRYLSAPAPDKLVSYDVTYSTGRSALTLDSGHIPFIDNAQHEYSREIEIPSNGHDIFRVRARYYGSGDVSIDLLKILYLGK